MNTLSKISTLAALSCVLLAGSAAHAEDGRRSAGVATGQAHAAFGAPSHARVAGRSEARALGSDVRSRKHEAGRGDEHDLRSAREASAPSAYRAGGRDPEAHQEKRSEPRRTTDAGRGQEHMRRR